MQYKKATQWIMLVADHVCMAVVDMFDGTGVVVAQLG